MLCADADHYRAQLHRAQDQLSAAVRTGTELNETLQRLMPLCPCDLNPETTDGPQRDCPIHGDGETFVAYVRKLERLLGAGRLWSSRVTVIRRTPPASMSTEAIGLLRAVAELDGAE